MKKDSSKQVMPAVIFLAGPTAIGKSDIALAMAKKIGGEIVSCDSMQVYKGMDIGTAKPAKAARKSVKHHGIDVVKPSQPFDAARYRTLAMKAIKGILRRRKTPIVVGGTGLYMRALLQGLFEGAGADEKLREQLQQEAAQKGSAWLHAELAKVDPISANKIHPNNTRKIIRALEVYNTLKRPISEMQGEWKNNGWLGRAPHRTPQPRHLAAREADGLSQTGPVIFPFPYRLIGLSMDRNELYKRIDRRVLAMFKKGLKKEVERLVQKGLKKNPVACQAIGYKEIIGLLDGQYDGKRALELVQRNSRRYAKRQFTWFRKDDNIQWIHVRPDQRPKAVAEEILASLKDPQSSP